MNSGNLKKCFTDLDTLKVNSHLISSNLCNIVTVIILFRKSIKNYILLKWKIILVATLNLIQTLYYFICALI